MSDPEKGHDSRVTSWRRPIQLAKSLRSRIGTKRSSISDVYVGPTSSARTPTRRSKRGALPDAKGRRAPLSPELWHCTAYPGISGSHLGSTLKPGGAVLTLGVFRRSRSVACIRADASPSEVLAEVIVPPNSEGVNLARGHDARLPPVKRRATSRVNAHGRNANVDRDTLWLYMNHDGRRRGRPRRCRCQHRRLVRIASGVEVTVSSYLLSGCRWMGDDGGAEPVTWSGKAVAASAK